MNKLRRENVRSITKDLSSVICTLKDLILDIKRCRDDEEDALYNIPENLSRSDRALSMEDNLDRLNDAIFSLEEAVGYLDEI